LDAAIQGSCHLDDSRERTPFADALFALTKGPSRRLRSRHGRGLVGDKVNQFGHRTPSVEVLRRTELFGSLTDDELQRLAAAARTRTFRRGQYLWYQGDPGDTLLVVCEGRLKVVFGFEPTGDEAVLHSVGSCEVLGELALLDGAPRSASVVALEQTTALILSRATVFDAMTRHPAVLEAMLRTVGRLVRRLTEQNGDLVFLDLGGRLAKLLLRLAEGRTPGNDGIVLDTHLSQSELAAMIGATRPAVNRVLHLFAARGLIRVEGQVIVLQDLPGLQRRATT
jgi:CRP/FNR family transcriptional regulator, cyclic AMP receptor protein